MIKIINWRRRIRPVANRTILDMITSRRRTRAPRWPASVVKGVVKPGCLSTRREPFLLQSRD
jgi:hypothetical protein